MTLASGLQSMSKNINEQVTIVTACRNREDNLKKVIQSWLAIFPFRIIICDWGSADPLTHERLGIRGHKDAVNIFRRESDRWILSWAFNEALLQVESKYTLKLDCDHLISNEFLHLNPPYFGQFSRGHWRHAEEGQHYINGAFMSCTDLLRRVGYYDERITTYGWDDSDLYSRLYDAGIGSSVFTKGSLRHLEQCEATRTKEQDVSKEAALARCLGIEKTAFLINRNRLLCGMMWPWNSNMFKRREEIRARFLAPEPEEEALIEHATLKAFELHYQWKGLQEKTGVPAGEAYADALYMLARKPCNAPTSLFITKLLKRYSEAVRNDDGDEKNLVRLALLANSRENRLKSRIKVLNDIDRLHQNSQSDNPSGFGCARRSNDHTLQVLVRKPKIFIDAQHGLGNRLRAIGSAAAIAEVTERELVIVWQPDDHCNCRFADLFDYEGVVLDVSLVNTVTDCKVYNYMTIEDGKKNALIRSDDKADIYARSAFVLNSPHSDCTRENRFIQNLKPVEAVQTLVNTVRHPNDVSAHVRMEGGRKDEHLPYESSANWTEDDHNLIDHWRSKSHVSHFIRRIDMLVAEGSAEHIFLAADCPEVYKEFQDYYGDRLALLQRSIYDRSARQLQYALADAILLSKSSLLLGSSWSSFTELALRLAAKPIASELSGVDF